VNDSWNPAEQRQKDTEQETGNATGHEHRKRRQNHAEKISQRFHHELFLFRFVLLFCRVVLAACRAVALPEAELLTSDF
jgi:hypothetical protein